MVESNPALIDELRSGCRAYVFGDVIEPDTFEKAKLTDARMVISTADSQPVNEYVMSFSEQVDVVVRTKDRESARKFLDGGAFYVGVSDLLAADRLEERFEALIAGEYDRETLRRESQETVTQYTSAPPRTTDGRTDI